MIQALFIPPVSAAPQQAFSTINVTANKGIIGDRNYDQHRWHGQNITLIEIENIDSFNQQYQQQIAIEDTRRNIITQGISLNELVGEEFAIGPIKLLGTELCEPCHTLSQQLASDTVSKQQVLKSFTHKAGIRATILSSGSITLDMPIIILKHKQYDD
jgi:MOSC domain-containing protein YiiM